MMSCLFLPFALISTCKDDKCGNSRDNYQYDLEAEVIISPIQPIYFVGDTINLSVTFPNPILDRNHNVLETLVDLNIRHGWWVTKIDEVTSLTIDATRNITVLPEYTTTGQWSIESSGQSTNVTGTLEKAEGGSYSIDYRFTLDSIGYYQFRIGQFVEREELAFTPDPIALANECGNGKFQISYKIRDYPQDNILLLCEETDIFDNCNLGLSDQEFIERFDEDWRRVASYIFKVR